MRIVMLAAGVGSRLGTPFPKPLTPLVDGRSILQRQLDAIRSRFRMESVIVVVGFKKELIMESFPDVLFAYNQDYGETNTSKSLLRALELTADEGVLWMNGDVVFEPELLDELTPHITAGRSFVCVNTANVGEEEVKYQANGDGQITQLSKQVGDAHGEAVGINYVAPADQPALVARLRACDASDYFERGIELAIEGDGTVFWAVDVGPGLCIEVDFPEDLRRANEAIDHT